MIKGIMGLFIAIVLIAICLPALYGVINEIVPGSSSTIVPILCGLILVLGVAVVSCFFKKR